MSSFHTANHATFCCVPGQTVKAAGHEQCCRYGRRGCDRPHCSEHGSPPGYERLLTFHSHKTLIGSSRPRLTSCCLTPRSVPAISRPPAPGHPTPNSIMHLAYIILLRYRTSSARGPRRHPVGYSHPCIRLVFTESEALTESETTASLPGDTPWNEYSFPPTQAVTGLQDVSASLSSSSAILILTPLQDCMPYSSAVAVPPSSAELPWLGEPGQFAGLATSYADGNGDTLGQYSDFTSVGAMS